MAKRQIHRIDLTIEETDGAWHVWRWASDVNGVDIPDYDFHCPCYPDKEGAVYDAIYTAKNHVQAGDAEEEVSVHVDGETALRFYWVNPNHGRYMTQPAGPKTCSRCGAISQGGVYCPKGCGRI